MKSSRFRLVLFLFIPVVLTAAILVAAVPDGSDSLTIDPKALSIMSGSLYFPLATELGLVPAPPLLPGIASSASLLGFRPYNVNVTSTGEHENEPSVLSTTISGTVYTATTFNRLRTTYQIGYSRRNENTGAMVGGDLPTHPTYQSYGDPFLDANIYGGGVAPGRIYNVGIMHNGFGAPNNAIGLWYSDDGGASWAGPTTVAANAASNVFLDKPAVVVSPAANSLGWVYVIYSRINSSFPASFELRVARSTDGGASFGSSSVVSTTRNGGQQILVAPNTGYVLAIWVDFDAQQIRMAQSSDFGSSWLSPEVATSATYFFLEGTINGNIRAVTIPFARFNRPHNRVSIVWHESDGAGGTDVYYTSKSAGGWQSKVLLSSTTANDQFMPSLAFDTAGNGIVGFYDRRQDPGNINFWQYGRKIDVNGSGLGLDFAISTFQNSAAYYPQNFIGDYQTAWAWPYPNTEQYVTAYTGNPTIAPGYWGDIWLGYVF